MSKNNNEQIGRKTNRTLIPDISKNLREDNYFGITT